MNTAVLAEIDAFLSKNAMIFLDYDGTLVEISPDPSGSYLDRDALHLLVAISEAYDLFIVTGRTLGDMERFLGNRFNLIALHGAIVKMKGSEPYFCQNFTEYKLKSAQVYAMRNEIIHDFPGIRIRDKGGAVSFTTWLIDNNMKPILRKKLSKIAEEYGFELWAGKEIYEMRIPGVNKGVAVRNIRNGRPAIIAGDDTTDEDAFRLNQDAITIKVGEGDTAARYRVSGVSEMLDILRFIAQKHHKDQAASV
ncbi:MAG: trehalose-phosphatase [Thermoplasmataceae archaeon]